MSELDKREKYSDLFEFYQKLFTDKQKTIFIDYYHNDFSLSEIAENEKVTKQAISDQIIKMNNQLDQYESKLQLFENDAKRRNLYNQLNKIENPQVSKIVTKLSNLEN